MSRPAAAAFSALVRSFELLTPELRRRWVLLVPLAVVAAVLEAVAASLIFTFIRLISGSGDGLGGGPILHLPWLGGGGGSEGSLVALGLVVAGVNVAKNAFFMFQLYAVHRAANEAVVVTASRLFFAYLSAPYVVHLERSSADLIRNIQNTADVAFRTVLAAGLSLISEVLVISTLLIVLFLSAPMITVALALVTAVLVGVILRLTHLRHRSLGKLGHELNRRLLSGLQQGLEGVKEVKVLGLEAYFARSYEGTRRELSSMHWQRSALEQAPTLFIETMFVLGVVAVVLASRALGHGDDVVPVLGLFGYAGFRVLPSISRSVLYVNALSFGAAPVEALARDWRELTERATAPRPDLSAAREVAAPAPFERAINLESLTYRYRGADRDAVSGISLEVRRGEVVAVVGRTGSGKSTLLHLLLGLLEPGSGRVTADGRNIHDELAAWQRKIGYVPQSIFLFDDTLRRNIALGVEDRDIDEGRLAEAIHLAQLTPLVASLPEGIETRVGERGVRLSGGERQRVAVARALYRRPEILVFDEATSALDQETERALAQAIERLDGTKTVIIVAHRLSTVRRADRLVLLEDGRIADAGTFDELLLRSERFRALARESPAGSG